MDPVTAELQFAGLIAEKLNLEVDQELFCGNLPDGITEGMSVKFTSGTLANMSELNFFAAEISGRYHSREAVRDHLIALRGVFPFYGDGNFTSAEADGPIQLDSIDEDRIFTLVVTVAFA